MESDVGPAERPRPRPCDLPSAPSRDPRQRRAGAAPRGGPLTRPNPLAGYEDWPAAVRSAEPYIGADAASTTLGRVLGLRQVPNRPTVHDEGSELRDGVLIRRLRWSVGYGPDTSAWLLRPVGIRRSLPGILGM